MRFRFLHKRLGMSSGRDQIAIFLHDFNGTKTKRSTHFQYFTFTQNFFSDFDCIYKWNGQFNGDASFVLVSVQEQKGLVNMFDERWNNNETTPFIYGQLFHHADRHHSLHLTRIPLHLCLVQLISFNKKIASRGNVLPTFTMVQTASPCSVL